MRVICVVDRPENWPLEGLGVEIVSSHAYLTDPSFQESSGTRVFNLCRRYGYQKSGYYVSLLAEARGHKPMPSVLTLQDLGNRTVLRLVSGELQQMIQHSMAPLKSNEFVLSIYFGKNLAQRYERLSRRLFNLFPAPLLRARFVKNEHWSLVSLLPIAAGEIPDSHREFVVQTARDYFARRQPRAPRRVVQRYHLALLVDPQETDAPSDEKALRKFERAARKLAMGTERIGRDDQGRLGEFDALFIRATTYVNHYTYRVSQRAEVEGLVVIDDPRSIVRCTNKVYLAESMAHRGISTPKTMIVNPGNQGAILAELGLPCVLKVPDSSFSRGVVKIETEEELERQLAEIFGRTDLAVAQAWTPSDYDWRVGVIDGHALYVCRYYMARGHWQIVRRDTEGAKHYGKVETMAVEQAPHGVVHTALRAAAQMGDGLYGVDLKSIGSQVLVMEVNDNPSIEAGYEDRVLGDELYRRIIATFVARLEQRGQR